jgi:hypothetical protein
MFQMRRCLRWVVTAGAVTCATGCGPSEGPDPDWFERNWFERVECFDEDPEFCYVSYATILTVSEDGSASLELEGVCGTQLEPPEELVWEEEAAGTVLLSSAEPGETFRWGVATPEAVRFDYTNDCRAKAELVDHPEVGSSETIWNAGEVAFERFSPMDCMGTVVATSDDPCTREFPRGFATDD